MSNFPPAPPQGAPPYPTPFPAYPGQPQPELRTGLATAALVLGIISLAFCFGGIVTGIVALILAIVALVKISSRPQEYGGKGRAVAGLVMGIVGFGLWTVVSIYSLVIGLDAMPVGFVNAALIEYRTANNENPPNLQALASLKSAQGILNKENLAEFNYIPDVKMDAPQNWILLYKRMPRLNAVVVWLPGGNDPQTLQPPLFEARWSAFVAEFEQKYGRKPTIQGPDAKQ